MKNKFGLILFAFFTIFFVICALECFNEKAYIAGFAGLFMAIDSTVIFRELKRNDSN